MTRTGIAGLALVTGLATLGVVGPLEARPSVQASTDVIKPPRPETERPATAPKPRAYLLYLDRDRDPIVVDGYREEEGQIVFEKYGGQIKIPREEVVRIVPDLPGAPPGLLPRPPGPPPHREGIAPGPRRSPARHYLSLRSGGNLKVSDVRPEGDRLRVIMDKGSFTIPASEVIGILRVPTKGKEQPEAWLTVKREGRPPPPLTLEAPPPAPAPIPAPPAAAPASPPEPEPPSIPTAEVYQVPAPPAEPPPPPPVTTAPPPAPVPRVEAARPTPPPVESPVEVKTPAPAAPAQAPPEASPAPAPSVEPTPPTPPPAEPQIEATAALAPAPTPTLAPLPASPFAPPDLPTLGTPTDLKSAVQMAPPPSETPEPPVPRLLPTVSSSDRPHLLQMASGETIGVKGFWIEEGEVKFHRFGGVVGVALSEVLKLVPEKPESQEERVPVRFARVVSPTVLEVRVKEASRLVRLLGIEASDGLDRSREPWRRLQQGAVLRLEFDREMEEADGTWLAYVFLPNGRMLNAELVKLRLARPALDPRGLKYLDLFHELDSLTAAGPAK